tara:strand:- start:184 stop:906 length:723 start_codon:yes stop_codon:yes gene_type:complete
MKSIAMIPLRMGSKRIPKKNIRFLGNLPLCFYIIKAVIDSDQFQKKDIFLNSEDDLFSSVADHFGISFYKRKHDLASDTATNDDFMFDFLENNSCDYVFQFLATSPLIKSTTIKDFVNNAYEFDTYISVVRHQIECIYNKNSINFEFLKKTPPSQSLEPIFSYACGLMGWRAKEFKDTFLQNNGAAYHGGNNKRGFFEISGIETIDVDNKEDFEMAELAIEALSLKKTKNRELKYWDVSV